MTVSSFTSLSLTPPQVLVSLAQNTRTHDLVTRSRLFGISILSAEQQEISNRFAGRVEDEPDRFIGLETFTLATGAPLITGGLAHLDCHVVTTLGSGTHTICIGEVLAAQNAGDGEPLMYFNRGYRKLV
jgi:flavin reductase (DIM6/NTAB) family NADH-FMN oxidoreductase RutF